MRGDFAGSRAQHLDVAMWRCRLFTAAEGDQDCIGERLWRAQKCLLCLKSSSAILNVHHYSENQRLLFREPATTVQGTRRSTTLERADIQNWLRRRNWTFSGFGQQSFWREFFAAIWP